MCEHWRPICQGGLLRTLQGDSNSVEKLSSSAKARALIIWELSYWQKVTTSNTTGGGVQMGSYPYPRNGILKLDYEFILVFKKLGDAPNYTKDKKRLSKMTPEEWNTFFAGHWNFAGARQSGHIAMFPEELPRRLIKMFSFVGETFLILLQVAGQQQWQLKISIEIPVSFEINPEFIPIIKEKLDVHQIDLNGTTYEFVKQQDIKIDFENQIKELPYIFKDPHTLDNKIDIKKLQFGSKIDQNSSTTREDFFTVKEVISPDKIRLSNDLTIKLIGIKEDPIVYNKATAFLTDKTKGKRVFLKYDSVKYDKENNLFCYLYLENKTFINAHLIKNGLVLVDSDTDYKYKDKFLNLQKEVCQ